MKTLFIEAKYDKPVQISEKIEEKLPSSLGLVSSIQFIDSLPLIKKQLKNKKTIIGGQILGCNVKNAEKIKNNVDAFLYIGDGRFHPLGVALATKKPVYKFDPITQLFDKIDDIDIETYKNRKKGALLKFFNADTVGVLVSTKSGQYFDINQLVSLKKKYPQKKFYTFIADTIDYGQLENFPFIQTWVNTACPRIEEDIKVVNISEI